LIERLQKVSIAEYSAVAVIGSFGFPPVRRSLTARRQVAEVLSKRLRQHFKDFVHPDGIEYLVSDADVIDINGYELLGAIRLE